MAVSTIAALRALATSEGSAVLIEAGKQGLFIWTAGDFTDMDDSLNVVKADGTALDDGAWVRQLPNSISYGPRTVKEKLDDKVSVKDFGARGLGGNSNDGPAIQEALDEAPLGSTVWFPADDYRTQQPIVQRRQLNIEFEPGVRLFGLNLPADKPMWSIQIEQACYGANDVRGMRWSGVAMYPLSGASSTLKIENVAPMASNLDMQFIRCAFGARDDQPDTAIHIKGVLTQLHLFLQCSIENGVHLDGCADGVRFLYCFTLGTKTAFRIGVAEGAFRTLFAHNVITNRDGAFFIEGGLQVDMLYNQIEHGPSYGANQAFGASHITVYPTRYPSGRINIIGNNFGGGNLAAPITLVGESTLPNNTIDNVFIDHNTFNPGTSGFDIRILNHQVRGTRIGPNNYLRGPRGGVSFDPYPFLQPNNLDEGELLSVFDLGVGTYGIWKDAATLDLAPEIATGATIRYKKTLDDVLLVKGKVTGTMGGGQRMLTFPVGFRSPVSDYRLVFTGAGTGALNIEAATGHVYSAGALSGDTFMSGLGGIVVSGRRGFQPYV